MHVGAEAALSTEDAVVGSADEADFVLEDEGVAGRHFVLRAVDDGVRLTVLDGAGPVRVGDREVDGGIDLAPYQVVSCGALALAVGPADEPWPDIRLPGTAAPEPVADDGSAEPTPGEAEAPVEEPAEASDAPVPPEHDDDAPAAARHWVFGAAVALSAVVLLAVGAWLAAPHVVERAHEDPADAAADIRAIAARYAARVDIATDADGIVHVNATVDTEQTRTRLLDELAGRHHRAVVHITSADRLADRATTALDQAINSDNRNAVDVAPVPGSPGELMVSGYVADEAVLARARALLARDVKDAKAFAYDVQTRRDRVAELRERLDARGLVGLRIQTFPGHLGLFGPVNAADLAAVREIVAGFNDEFGPRPPLEIAGTDTLLGESTIDLDVRAVVLGENAHVVLHDGTSAARGATVAGGYVIDTIAERYMVLRRPVDRIGDGQAADFAYLVFDAR